MQKYIPTIIKNDPKKNLTSNMLSPFSTLWVINVIMNVMQLVNGDAMLRSLAATKKLFRMFPSWFTRNGIKNFMFENIDPVSDNADFESLF